MEVGRIYIEREDGRVTGQNPSGPTKDQFSGNWSISRENTYQLSNSQAPRGLDDCSKRPNSSYQLAQKELWFYTHQKVFLLNS